jgi:hypothetical protein
LCGGLDGQLVERRRKSIHRSRCVAGRPYLLAGQKINKNSRGGRSRDAKTTQNHTFEVLGGIEETLAATCRFSSLV